MLIYFLSCDILYQFHEIQPTTEKNQLSFSRPPWWLEDKKNMEFSTFLQNFPLKYRWKNTKNLMNHMVCITAGS